MSQADWVEVIVRCEWILLGLYTSVWGMNLALKILKKIGAL